MTITVGTDTYISVADADIYFTANTLSAKSVTWLALSVKDKEICLKNSCKMIDRLHFIGHKQTTTQALEFPRYFTEWYDVNCDWLRNYTNYDGTPKEILEAQCELALYLYQNQSNQIAKAQQMGLKSISLGNESYSFSDKYDPQGLPSAEAMELVNKWLRKAFKVG